MKEFKNFLNRYKWLILSGLFLIFIPVLIYSIYFHNHDYSESPEQWAQFGDYVGGIVNPIIGVFSIVILGYISVKLGKDATDKQRDLFDTQQRTEAYNNLALEYAEFIKAIDLIQINGSYHREFGKTEDPKKNLYNFDVPSIVMSFSNFLITLKRFPIFYGHLFSENLFDFELIKTIHDLEVFLKPFLYPDKSKTVDGKFETVNFELINKRILVFFERLQRSI